ncbi:TerB N-terminal domain-containing protein [Bradyrhizobium sp. INPA03-11B]|uniref:tellurite resistance TerB family protein n=1 Tax=Bradyrhizobium sp. INPA03-11B TaxID=418598 RepID=UPI00338E900B
MLGVLIAALTAVYQFVVEHLAAVGTICLVLALAFLLVRFGTRKQSPVPVAGSIDRAPVIGAGPRASSAKSGGKSPPKRPGTAKWVRPGEAVTIQSIDVSSGLFYFGPSLWFEGREIDAYAVNPQLPAKSSRPDVAGASMPYWPSYADVPPAARCAFLDWMSTGRRSTSYGIGHVFLFFYGLEHRLFVERDLASAPELIAEVERLAAVRTDSDSFQGYAKRFLDVARCAAGIPLPVPEISPERSYSTEIDLGVRIHVGQRLSQSRVLLSEDALIWVLALQDVYLRTAAVRCFDEFVALWHLRFRARFAEGFIVDTSGNIDVQYQAASGAFSVHVDGPHRDYPDVAKATKSPERLRQLVQDCTDELDSFSRLLGKRPDARNSVQAALMLPRDLLSEAGFEALNQFKARLSQVMGGQGRASTKMRTVLQAANFEVQEQGKVSPGLADQLSQVLDLVDVAIEPDRRFGSAVPQLDDQVFLFSVPGGGHVDPERPAYRTMKAQVEVAVLAAAADGQTSGDEMSRVIAGIRDGKEDLSAIERARLIAFAVTTFNSPPKLSRVMKRLAERSDAEREAIANAALAVVGGSGSVDPDEVRFLERLHKALGLPKERVYSELHRAAPRNDEPVAISEERREAGISIPKEAPPKPDFTPGVKIDAVRLARTQRETAVVSELLANIFEEEPAPSTVETPVASAANGASFEGLDGPHTELLELIELKGSIPKVEFEERARAMKLLPEGALERINDWSFDRFDEPLLEEGDEIVMAPQLRPRLAELRETTT